MTGFSFEVSNTFWPDAVVGMHQRSVFVSVAVGCNTLSWVQKLIVPLQVTNKQWILYGNSHLKVDQYHTKLTSYFSRWDLLLDDIVKITGPMFKEQKMVYTNLLLAGQRATSTIGAIGDDVVYSPTGCIATQALGAAGWDGCHISLVMSFDLLTDLISVVQEKG